MRLLLLLALVVTGCASSLTAEKLASSREGGRSLKDLSNEQAAEYCRDLRALQELTADETRRGSCGLLVAMLPGDKATCDGRYDACIADPAPRRRAVSVADCEAWSRRPRECDVTLADDAACIEEMAAAMKTLAARGKGVCAPPAPRVSWPTCDSIATRCGQHPLAFH